jgi:glutathione S-transferase
MIVFTSLAYSPWSEKARWALDHHQLAYKAEDYVPVLGEFKLRLRLRKLSGRITVPVLYDGQSWLTDSFDIARYADRVGQGARLFPDERLAEISQWNERSEAALAAGRALLMLAMADNADFGLGFLPLRVPTALRPLLVPVAKKGIAAFIAKYRMRDAADRHEAVFRRELDRLAKELAGRSYLLGDAFSYADIAMALTLQGISPVDERYLARVPGTSDNAFSSELLQSYAPLFAWRDELYRRHRRPATTRLPPS